MQKSFTTLREVKDLEGKRVLLRADCNEEIIDEALVSDFKIKKTLPTLSFLREQGAHIILLSHHSKEGQSLEAVSEYLKKEFPVTFVANIYNTKEIDEALLRGDVVFCENLRFWEGEKKNDEVFSEYLASLGEIYVNDAFGVSHRAHASIVSLPQKLPAYAGMLLEEEIERLTSFSTPSSPSLLILGGAKAKNKLSSAKKLINIFEEVFFGGVLANHLLKEKGFSVGDSLLDDGVSLDGLGDEPRVILPQDVLVESQEGILQKEVSNIIEGERILDIGAETIRLLESKIKKAETIVVVGALGMYEKKGFEKGTYQVLDMVRKGNAVSLVGGGDTARFILGNNLRDGFTFISTGGGALLTFLAEGTLPGVEALKK